MRRARAPPARVRAPLTRETPAGVRRVCVRPRGAVNKQLNDKERVAAALENPALLDKVNLCLSGKMAM